MTYLKISIKALKNDLNSLDNELEYQIFFIRILAIRFGSLSQVHSLLAVNVGSHFFYSNSYLFHLTHPLFEQHQWPACRASHYRSRLRPAVPQDLKTRYLFVDAPANSSTNLLTSQQKRMFLTLFLLYRVNKLFLKCIFLFFRKKI